MIQAIRTKCRFCSRRGHVSQPDQRQAARRSPSPHWRFPARCRHALFDRDESATRHRPRRRLLNAKELLAETSSLTQRRNPTPERPSAFDALRAVIHRGWQQFSLLRLRGVSWRHGVPLAYYAKHHGIRHHGGLKKPRRLENHGESATTGRTLVALPNVILKKRGGRVTFNGSGRTTTISHFVLGSPGNAGLPKARR
jgi:hypothetical protein